MIPSIHREQLLEEKDGKDPASLVITGHPAKYVMLMSKETYLRYEKDIVGMPVKDMNAQYFRTTFCGYADDGIEPDRLGRIMIPPTLRTHANLKCKGEALVFGMRDHLQLWNESDWASLAKHVAPSSAQYEMPAGWENCPI